MMNIHTYLSPHFLAQLYLSKDVGDIVKKFNFTGTLLDIGCGEKPYLKYFLNIQKYVGIDYKIYSKHKSSPIGKPDMYFARNYSKNFILPFKDKEFDHVVSFQVLEHHPEPDILMSEMRRVVKKGGYLVLTFPFIWSLHEAPHDYHRFTEYYIQSTLEKNNFQLLELKRQGSIFSTISILLNDYLVGFMQKNKYRYIFGVCIYPIFLLFSYLCFFLDYIFKSNIIFLNYAVLARAH